MKRLQFILMQQIKFMKWFKEAKHHLEVETGWTYTYHLKHSCINSWWLIKIAFWSLVHGLFPWIWKSKAPQQVIKMYYTIRKIPHIREMDNG